MNSPRTPESDDAIRAEAIRWTVKRDRGLSASESIEFELWLAADERHAAALKRASGAWAFLDQMPEHVARPVLDRHTRRRAFWRRTTRIVAGMAAVAALIAVGVHFAPRLPWGANAGTRVVASGPREATLTDGTVVHMNEGSEVIEQFTSTERRVQLAKGEANFAVTKNPLRPFVVQAGKLRVRAVGTAFNVKLRTERIEVLVTEGTVQLSRGQSAAAAAGSEAPLVQAGQQAVVTESVGRGESAAPIEVRSLNRDEIDRAMAWQEPLLRLGGGTLAELVLEFERHSGRRVVLADPSLGSLRVGGRFRASDADGFAALIARTLDLEVEYGSDGALVLRRKK